MEAGARHEEGAYTCSGYTAVGAGRTSVSAGSLNLFQVRPIKVNMTNFVLKINIVVHFL